MNKNTALFGGMVGIVVGIAMTAGAIMIFSDAPTVEAEPVLVVDAYVPESVKADPELDEILEGKPAPHPALAAQEEDSQANIVIGVIDGDTLTVLVGNGQIKVRLNGIDAPEIGQPWGRNSKRRLSDFAYGKECTLDGSTKDRYGRTLADVIVDGRSANLILVSEGLAWHYKKYNKDTDLADAETKARKEQIGLWSDKRQTPPWDWRKMSSGDRTIAVSGRAQSVTLPSRAPPAVTNTHWLNSNSGVRHNSSCRWYGSTKSGHACSGTAGRACGKCGG